MPRHDASYHDRPNATLSEVVRSMRHLPMTAEIRDAWQYCNIFFKTLSHVVETLTGGWIGTYFHDTFWQPLGMNATFLSLKDAKDAADKPGGPPLARGYVWDDSSQKLVERAYMDSPIVSGAGHVISNVVDYATYLRAMLTMDDTILSEASYTELRTPRSFMDAKYTEDKPWLGAELYSLGWMIGDYRGHAVFHHGGSVPGFGAEMAYYPGVSDGLGIVIMANTEGSSNFVAELLTFDILDECLGTPKMERWDFVKQFDEIIAKRRTELDPAEARKKIYPDAPRETLPLPLPLESYAGTFWNDGYRNVTIEVAKNEDGEEYLKYEALDRTWQHTITFEHVTGNYFLAWMHTVGKKPNASMLLNEVFAAEFRAGPDSRVSRVGIQYEPRLKEKIWFDRVDQ
jgi:hypothetical protein